MLTGYFVALSHAFHPPRITGTAPVRSTAVPSFSYRKDCGDAWSTLTKHAIYGLLARLPGYRKPDGV